MKNFLFNADYVLNRERNAWVDYVKGICILLVCYRHSFEGLNTDKSLDLAYPALKFINVYFYGFRMPMFFLVSGIFVDILVNKMGTKAYVKNRFKTVFYPLLIWGFIQITLQLLLKEWVNADRSAEDYLNLLIIPRKIEQFWYLNALFFVGVFYVLVKAFARINALQQIALGLVLYALSAWLNSIPTAALFFTDICQYYIFFALGAYLSGYILNNKTEPWLHKPWIWVGASLLFFGVQTWFYLLNTAAGKDFYVQNHLPIQFLFGSLIGCFFVMMVGKWLALKKWGAFLRIIGYHSLYIYLLHVMVLASIRNLFLHGLNMQQIPLLILVAVLTAILAPIILFNVFSRFGFWWLFTAKKPPFIEESAVPARQ